MPNYKEDSARFTVRGATNLAFGQGGRTFTPNTTPVSAEDNDCDFYHTIVCLTDTVFVLLSDLSSDGSPEVGITFAAGTYIYGVITHYTLSSGSVHAYKALNTSLGGE